MCQPRLPSVAKGLLKIHYCAILCLLLPYTVRFQIGQNNVRSVAILLLRTHILSSSLNIIENHSLAYNALVCYFLVYIHLILSDFKLCPKWPFPPVFYTSILWQEVPFQMSGQLSSSCVCDRNGHVMACVKFQLWYC